MLSRSGPFLVHLDRCTDDLADRVRHVQSLRPLRLCDSAANHFTSASLPLSMLITAISVGSTPFFSAQ